MSHSWKSELSETFARVFLSLLFLVYFKKYIPVSKKMKFLSYSHSSPRCCGVELSRVKVSTLKILLVSKTPHTRWQDGENTFSKYFPSFALTAKEKKAILPEIAKG